VDWALDVAVPAQRKAAEKLIRSGSPPRFL